MICPRCGNETYHTVGTPEGQICSDCYNMEKYEKGEEGFFLCPICGKADSPTNWSGGLPRGLCFNCSFWTGIKEEYDKGHKLVIDGNAYQVGEELPDHSPAFRGFAGRRFTIRQNGGKIIKTSNLWHNGKIPDRFREQMPDNAKFIQTL